MLELRTSTFERDGNKLGGYAMVWDAPSKPLTIRGLNGGAPFTERVVGPQAVEDSLRKNVDLLIGHDRRELVANSKSGLLNLRTDSRGLAFEVTLPDTTRARDVRAMVEAGILSEMSFGFYTLAESWKGSERTLNRIDLREVSIVSDAAYPQAGVAIRNHEDATARLRLRLRVRK